MSHLNLLLYIVYRENMLFLSGFCLLPEKQTLFFSILNKQLPIVSRYLEEFCPIIEYSARSTSSEFIYCRRTGEFLGERIPSVLISGKIIWEKKQSFVRISFRAKQVNQCPHHGGVTKKNIFFTEHLLLPGSRHSVLFSFRIEKGERALEEEEN